ncbi:40S ribosomal protein S27-like [Theropithecus gelada]|uniref:40S ribosomal protein S27-like n=1 Tax=Theropithecus gelada TaxID=9565 RepID=UPI000DC1ABBA|nr:40S ribosomal protein S27-like [Theropithecus gelada]
MPLAKDLLHPSPEEEKRKHKKKRLVQSPSSYFMDVKCPGCYKITTVFSHAQTVVLCVGCSTVLCQPTGGKARLTEGCSFRRKQHKGTLNQDDDLDFANDAQATSHDRESITLRPNMTEFGGYQGVTKGPWKKSRIFTWK